MNLSTEEFSASYYDGCGNGYKIRNNELKYEPMTPEQSSSGTYSGGDPKLIKLDKDQSSQLKTLFETAFENCSTNKNRMMGTGRLFMDGKVCNLAMRNKAKIEIESYFKVLMD